MNATTPASTTPCQLLPPSITRQTVQRTKHTTFTYNVVPTFQQIKQTTGQATTSTTALDTPMLPGPNTAGVFVIFENTQYYSGTESTTMARQLHTPYSTEVVRQKSCISTLYIVQQHTTQPKHSRCCGTTKNVCARDALHEPSQYGRRAGAPEARLRRYARDPGSGASGVSSRRGPAQGNTKNAPG